MLFQEKCLLLGTYIKIKILADHLYILVLFFYHKTRGKMQDKFKIFNASSLNDMLKYARKKIFFILFLGHTVRHVGS